MSANHAAGIPLQAWRLGGPRTCGLHGDSTEPRRCPLCGGGTGAGSSASPVVCPCCHGKGTLPGRCATCDRG